MPSGTRRTARWNSPDQAAPAGSHRPPRPGHRDRDARPGGRPARRPRRSAALFPADELVAVGAGRCRRCGRGAAPLRHRHSGVRSGRPGVPLRDAGGQRLRLLRPRAVDRPGPVPRVLGPTSVVLGTGLVGAYTTFSTFSFETVALLEDGEVRLALGTWA